MSYIQKQIWFLFFEKKPHKIQVCSDKRKKKLIKCRYYNIEKSACSLAATISFFWFHAAIVLYSTLCLSCLSIVISFLLNNDSSFTLDIFQSVGVKVNQQLPQASSNGFKEEFHYNILARSNITTVKNTKSEIRSSQTQRTVDLAVCHFSLSTNNFMRSRVLSNTQNLKYFFLTDSMG